MNKTRRGFLVALAVLPGLGFLRRPQQQAAADTDRFKFKLGTWVSHPDEKGVGRIVGHCYSAWGIGHARARTLHEHERCPDGYPSVYHYHIDWNFELNDGKPCRVILPHPVDDKELRQAYMGMLSGVGWTNEMGEFEKA